MELIFTDALTEHFTQYGITTEYVRETYTKSDKNQKLTYNYDLFLKEFKENGLRRRWLLIGVRTDNNPTVDFAYWVTHQTAIVCVKNYDLMKLLEMFAVQFGFRVEQGVIKGKEELSENPHHFIRNTTITGTKEFKLMEFFQPIVIKGAPCAAHSLTYERPLGENREIKVTFFFITNLNKYHIWVHSVPVYQAKVRADMYFTELERIIEVLEPNGNTEVKLREHIEEAVTGDPKQFMGVEIPQAYKGKFDHICERVNKAAPGTVGFEVDFSYNLNCLFCDLPKPLTAEHIFSKWLRLYIKEMVAPTVRKIGDNPKLFPVGKFFSYGFVDKCVCAPCNNEWMSQLEEKVEDILVKNGKFISEIPPDINEAEAKTLSVWLIMKMLLAHNNGSKYNKFFYKNVYTEIMNSNIPSGFVVEASTSTSHTFDFGIMMKIYPSHLIQTTKMSKENISEQLHGFYTAGFQFGNLIFRISYLTKDSLFIRKTKLIRTLKLFPFGYEMEHIVVPQEDKLRNKMALKHRQFEYLHRDGLILSD